MYRILCFLNKFKLWARPQRDFEAFGARMGVMARHKVPKNFDGRPEDDDSVCARYLFKLA